MKLFRVYRDPKWHNWFAWRPVWAKSTTPRGNPCMELIWLETVERRATFSGMDGSFCEYEYAKIPKLLNSK